MEGSEDEHLPAYAVNVFVPLVDMDASLGPTEFVPTTHLLSTTSSSSAFSFAVAVVVVLCPLLNSSCTS